MADYGLLIDYEYCTGCESCVVACKEENGFPIGKWGIRVLDDGPWQKDDAGEGGNHFNWNKIPVPTDLAICAPSASLKVRSRRASTIAWRSACNSAPSPNLRRSSPRSLSRFSGRPASLNK